MPLTWVDHWIAQINWAMPAYLSLWIYVSLPPCLLFFRRSLVVYGTWLAALCAVCLAIFYFIPTQVPVTGVDGWNQLSEGLLEGLDAKGNACPSLHAATAVFSGWWVHRLFRTVKAPVWAHTLNMLYCLVILWSTIATRQHVFVDVAAGAAIALPFMLVADIRIRQKIPAEGLQPLFK